MANDGKRILVVALRKKTEALRMAGGLTLLEDPVKVRVVGELDDPAEAEEQLEMLEFGEVPVVYMDGDREADVGELADDILEADVVYMV